MQVVNISLSLNENIYLIENKDNFFKERKSGDLIYYELSKYICLDFAKDYLIKIFKELNNRIFEDKSISNLDKDYKIENDVDFAKLKTISPFSSYNFHIKNNPLDFNNSKIKNINYIDNILTLKTELMGFTRSVEELNDFDAYQMFLTLSERFPNKR